MVVASSENLVELAEMFNLMLPEPFCNIRTSGERTIGMRSLLCLVKNALLYKFWEGLRNVKKSNGTGRCAN